MRTAEAIASAYIDPDVSREFLDEPVLNEEDSLVARKRVESCTWHPHLSPFLLSRAHDILHCIMRVHLTAHTGSFGMETGLSQPVILTVRPACKLPGDYRYTTDNRSLLKLLRQGTELRSSVLESFEQDLQITKAAKLLNVEMSDRVLTDIGYFVD